MGKRTLDIILSLVGIVLSSPIMLLTAILIRMDSAGPVIFRQPRVGKDGKLFSIYKFRTMIDGAPKLGPTITGKNDPRITQVGQILRWLKIDELPQFFNVLKGDMSFVGPRPEVPNIVEKYSEEERKVLSVKPGILGPGQITNRDESEMLGAQTQGNVEDYYIEKILPGKILGDLAYIKSKDPFKDMRILLGGAATLILTSIKLRYILESKRRIFFLLMDLAICAFSYCAAFALRYEGNIPASDFELMMATLPFIVLFKAPFFIYFGLYQSLWQYLGIQELYTIIQVSLTTSLLVPLIPFMLQVGMPPRSVLIIDGILLIMLLGGTRIVFKLTAERLRKPYLESEKKNVLIVGAEDSGELLIREFIKRPDLGYRPIGFVDDDPQKLGVRIHGIKVIGKISQLPQVAKIKKIEEVIIALSEVQGHKIKEITKTCKNLNIPCRILPQTYPLLSTQVLPLRLRPVDVSDLLGRELVNADVESIRDFFKDKRVLLTGAGGSIGSELARIIFQSHPRELVLVDDSENNLYDIEMDLNARSSGVEVTGYLRNVTHYLEMRKIFERHKPQVVYHAAAFKHVPLMEIHFGEGVINNVLGTKVMADLSLQFEAECFTLISTDKAIRPTSLMGATKRTAELYTQSLKGGKTKFVAVRFGNVFNSKGSVVPLFKKQIEEGGPVTITDPNVTRYFMDVSEAVYLILQASILGSDSQIFVLDMGQPIKIVDLAKDLMQLMGVNEKQIPMKYIGLRPGEKLEEEIELKSEQGIATEHKKIKIWKAQDSSAQNITQQIDELIMLIHQGATRDTVVQKLKAIVPEYTPWRLPC